MTFRHLAVAAVAITFSACAGTPGPGDSGYPFNVQGTYSGSLSADGQGFSAEVMIETEAGGIVTGSFEVTQPVRITGTLEGMLVGDQLTMQMEYGNNPVSGCSGGTVSGTLSVEEGGSVFGGDISIDDCGTMLSGRARFER